jgi:hypothetical protein
MLIFSLYRRDLIQLSVSQSLGGCLLDARILLSTEKVMMAPSPLPPWSQSHPSLTTTTTTTHPNSPQGTPNGCQSCPTTPRSPSRSTDFPRSAVCHDPPPPPFHFPSTGLFFRPIHPSMRSNRSPQITQRNNKKKKKKKRIPRATQPPRGRSTNQPTKKKKKRNPLHLLKADTPTD